MEQLIDFLIEAEKQTYANEEIYKDDKLIYRLECHGGYIE